MVSNITTCLFKHYLQYNLILIVGFLLWHTTGYFHIITMINMNAALFYINSRAIKGASNSLSKSFKEVSKPRLYGSVKIIFALNIITGIEMIL